MVYIFYLSKVSLGYFDYHNTVKSLGIRIKCSM